MKRQHIKQYEHGIFKHFSLFRWHLCCACNKEFRREKGWRFLSGPFFNGHGHLKYVCAKCVPTKERANEYALNSEWMPPRPPAPPPPPVPKR